MKLFELKENLFIFVSLYFKQIEIIIFNVEIIFLAPVSFVGYAASILEIFNAQILLFYDFMIMHGLVLKQPRHRP